MPSRSPWTWARPLLRVLAAVGVSLALLGVFSLYTQPEFMVEMSQQLWACF
jgi:hypothetical protein